ncbi:MAG: phosphonate ABC transporter, permease protein PhnE [Hyphomicrobiales bacterium]|nr:phosphonate ABC transporter, permease protein PhnE [Hyphomicrobiales bacterium]MBV8663397.1 phosphonate ABC transporter, permease protein PhnE [Hyphomicrobiales bacterium]
MSNAVVRLPDRQLAPLRAAYERAARAKRLQFFVAAFILAVLIGLSAFEAEVAPSTFLAKIGGFFSYFDRLMTLDSGARVWTDPVSWFWALKRSLRLIGQTILMAYVGTLTGSAAALALNFLASPNLTGSGAIVFATRRFLEFCRTVPDVVFALVFVVAFGLGPLPGVLAIAIHGMGALGKQFFETTENIDMKPVEGLRACGASWIETVRFAALPQVLPSFLSFALLRFEINVRSATVLGFVGAGGIGQDLMEAIRKFYYSDVSAILVLIIAAVVAIDVGTGYLRRALIGSATA